MSLLCFSSCASSPAPQEVSAETIGVVDQTSQIINQQMPVWMFGVVILLAGWAIPTPKVMFKGIVNVWRMFIR